MSDAAHRGRFYRAWAVLWLFTLASGLLVVRVWRPSVGVALLTETVLVLVVSVALFRFVLPGRAPGASLDGAGGQGQRNRPAE